MSGPMRIKGYDEIIEALDEARTTAGYLSDWCVKTINENETLRARVASLEAALREWLDAYDVGAETSYETTEREISAMAAARAALAAAPKEEEP